MNGLVLNVPAARLQQAVFEKGSIEYCNSSAGSAYVAANDCECGRS